MKLILQLWNNKSAFLLLDYSQRTFYGQNVTAGFFHIFSSSSLSVSWSNHSVQPAIPDTLFPPLYLLQQCPTSPQIKCPPPPNNILVYTWQYHRADQCTGPGERLPSFEAQPYHLLALWHWQMKNLTKPFFLRLKIRIIPTSWIGDEDENFPGTLKALTGR